MSLLLIYSSRLRFSLRNTFFENRCFLSRLSSISSADSLLFVSVSLVSVLSSAFSDLSFLDSSFFDSVSEVDSVCAVLSLSDVESAAVLSFSTGNPDTSFLPVKVSVICLHSSRLSPLPSTVKICKPSFCAQLPLPILPTLLDINCSISSFAWLYVESGIFTAILLSIVLSLFTVVLKSTLSKGKYLAEFTSMILISESLAYSSPLICRLI